MMIFLMLGFIIGEQEEQITSMQVVGSNVTAVAIDLGIALSDISIMMFALSVLAFFVGIV